MAITDFRDATAEIIDVLQTIPGIRRVPDDPPEDNEQFPFLVAMAQDGVYTQGPAQVMKALHSVRLELHVSRKDLPRDYKHVMKLIDEIPYYLMKHLNDGGFSNLATFGEITYIFDDLAWAGTPTLGVIYTVTNVKVQTAIT